MKMFAKFDKFAYGILHAMIAYRIFVLMHHSDMEERNTTPVLWNCCRQFIRMLTYERHNGNLLNGDDNTMHWSC